ncbi:hydrolase [Capnocytophaga cynodegmi]|uniref:Putative hydrolase n=1 Tax=Capnocytophaga cynodegmi TaxID=28189 RepID=A0A0B7HCK2_9FLAO|nr:hydrolase [Capnocytophaga cynodegmi]CEN35288.1 putative hydrolase [Capnocytophaga cynodegmi]CEN39669.1 putative hydrolase [Capnocytophaga cynodegmi]
MNKNIFIVLFVLSAILNLILLTTKQKKTNEQVQTSENHLDKSLSLNEKEILIDSIRKLTIEKSELKYFNLDDNTYARDYFAKMGIKNPTELVTSAILKTNTDKKQYSLIRFKSQNDSFQINKVKVLNNKWLICDFSDGENWGELLIKYQINDDKKINFIVFDDLIYSDTNE